MSEDQKPAISPEKAAKLMLTPIRKPAQGAIRADLGDQFWIHGPEGRIAAWKRGNGLQVLLVHGWDSNGEDMFPFVEPLIDAGFRTLTIDLTAHGQSDGESASIPLCAQTLLDVQKNVGPPSAIIAHLVGTAVTVNAMGIGLQVGPVVLIGAPAHYVDYARGMAKQLGLGTEGFEAMLAVLKERGVDVYSVSTPQTARSLTQPTLFIHSDDDKVVPVDDALQSVAAWRGARMLRLDGLGHRGILRASEVVSASVEFVRQKLSGNSANRQ